MISVIVPIYNVEKYIHRCIDSILAQSFKDFEIILVDDGSLDNCGKICDEYAEIDSRIFVIHKKNGGLSDARNVGIDWAFEHSNSEWITFIDSDDWIHQKYLEALYKALVDTGCDISACAYKETDGNTPIVDTSMLCPQVCDTEQYFCENNVNAVIACAKLYKKELFYDIRYPVGKVHEDEFTTYKLLFQNDICAFINQPLYFYFNNNSSITKSVWIPKRMDAIEALELQIDFFYKENYSKAYRKSVNNLLWTLSKYIKTIEKSKEYQKECNFLKNFLRKELKKYKKVFDLPLNRYGYYFEVAYPRTMKLYWTAHALVSKLKTK